MTLKTKITLILLSVILLFGAANFGIQRFIIFPSFLTLEREEAITDLKRSVDALQREISFLDFLVWDWAAWDETYEFIESRSDEYIKANLVLETFSDDNLNLLYILDTSGKVIWGETRDRQAKITHLPEFPADAFPADHPLLSFNIQNKPLAQVSIAGVYMTAKGPMLLSSRPIITSQSKGPIRGALIIGKYLTDKIIKKLAEQTKVDFLIYSITPGNLPEPLKDIPSRITDAAGYVIESNNADYVDAYTALPDIHGNPALLVKAKIPKHISAKGYTSMRYAIYSILAAGFGVLIVMLILLQSAVFGPIKEFTNHVISVGKTGDLSTSFAVQRQDEIGIMASEFNRLLEQLEKFQAELELMVNERTVELTAANEKLSQEIIERKQAEEVARKSEERLARSKRMESLGLLAGGIAHDLNNILMGTVLIPEMLLMDLPEEDPIREDIIQIKEAGHSASNVVSELLTVARGVAAVKEVVNLNTIIEGFLSSPDFKQIEKLHPAIALTTQLDPNLLKINCSSVHIKKCLLNLVVNAYESIADSGNIVIFSRNCHVDEPLSGYEDVRKGEYAILTVSDNGAGISANDIERIFEPFYTKKVMGRSGTGLGLAVVWNTVKSHEGYINIESGEGGTQFELLFPITRDELPAEKEAIPVDDYIGNGENILVVDDEEKIREIACRTLARLGYSTRGVSSGEEAIEFLKDHSVDLIVLDMIMPKGMNGRETYEKVIKIAPDQKAIIASAVAETVDVKAALELGVGKFLEKPYTIEQLGMAVKEEIEK